MKRAPQPPKELNDAAAAAWRMFCAQIGDVKPSDHAALATLARAWATLEHAESKLTEQGEVIEQPNGWMGANPFAKVRRENRATVITLLRQFGLSPASRAGLAGEKEKAAIDFSDESTW